MKIIGLPALVGSYDNYIWLLVKQDKAWVIDPGQAQPVLNYLTTHQLNLAGILITHYHHDHVEGIAELKTQFPATKVYGPQKTPNALIEQRLVDGDEVTLFKNYHLKVMETPGHTYDHIAYYNQQDLFCGDTLFGAGCGRQFDGGYEAFAKSLLNLRALPDDLNFYSAHEYTLSNLKFAQFADPTNVDLQNRITQTHIEYPKTMLTPQSTLKLEKATNPFLRFDMAPLQETLLARGAQNTPESLFKTLRDWKDHIDKKGYPET